MTNPTAAPARAPERLTSPKAPIAAAVATLHAGRTARPAGDGSAVASAGGQCRSSWYSTSAVGNAATTLSSRPEGTDSRNANRAEPRNRTSTVSGTGSRRTTNENTAIDVAQETAQS